MEELQEALNKLRQLERDTTRHDIEDTLKAVGTFLYRELDGVIYAIDNAIDAMKDNEEYIASLEEEVDELKSAKAGESK